MSKVERVVSFAQMGGPTRLVVGDRELTTLECMEILTVIITPGRCPECAHETVHDDRGCTHAGTYQNADGSWDLSGINKGCLCSRRRRFNPRFLDVQRLGLKRARQLARGRSRA